MISKNTLAALLPLFFMLMLGCAGKKPLKRSQLPLKTGVRIEFRGIKDANCVIGDVFVNATGGYVVVCK